MKSLYAAILLIFATSSHAETAQALGQQVQFTNPAGYCTLGNTPRERLVWEMTQRAIAPGARLIHAAVRCTELADYKSGLRDEFDHWLQIQLLGAKGEFKRVEASRDRFISAIASSASRVNVDEIERRVSQAFTEADVSVTGTQINTIGRDGNAAYMTLRANMAIGDRSRPITGMGGVTLINSLPMTVLVYEGTATTASRSRLRPTLQELLSSLLTQN